MKAYVQMIKHGFLCITGTLLILLFTACSTSSTTPTSSADTPSNNALYGTNVIVNGDAESGTNDQNGDKPVSTIPGWTKKGDIDIVPYGSSVGVPTTTDIFQQA